MAKPGWRVRREQIIRRVIVGAAFVAAALWVIVSLAALYTDLWLIGGPS